MPTDLPQSDTYCTSETKAAISESKDFKHHLWLSTVPSLTQLVCCYLACGWYSPSLSLWVYISLILGLCVPLSRLIGRRSHRETDRSHAELIACGGRGALIKCKAHVAFAARM